jgi:DNA polymerase elongation subunit (family B)
MISKEQYNEAKKIVEAYDEQLRIANVMRSELMAEKQIEREAKCGDHYYLPRGKWQSGMQCQDCGKVID